MKINLKYAILVVFVLAGLGGGWLYLQTPSEGRPCISSQGIKADAAGTLFVCQEGANWKQ